MIRFVGVVKPFIEKDPPCFFCLVSFPERTKIRGSAGKSPNVEQQNITELERDHFISLFYNIWPNLSLIDKNG